MKLSYRLKLIILITSLLVLSTSLSLTVFYRYAYNITMDSLKKNLQDVVEIGNLLIKQNIDAVKRLSQTLDHATEFSDEEINTIVNGGVINNFSQDFINQMQSGKDFLKIAKLLGSITLSSLHDNKYTEKEFVSGKTLAYLKDGAIAPYLAIMPVKYRQYDIVQTVASPAYLPVDDIWPGNPIGTSWQATASFEVVKTGLVFTGEPVTDSFYTALFASIPIYDGDQLIAFLEIDYPVGKQLNKLRTIRLVSYSLIAFSFISGLFISLLVSKRMSRSLKVLHNAAEVISRNDYEVRVDISDKDEFGMLGKVFNQMTSAVGETTSALKSSNERLRSITADMHDGVGSVLTSIQIATREGYEADDKHIHTLAKQGMAEVRFLMDALEYDDCDFELLCEGVELLAAEILKPKVVSYNLAQSGLGDTEIPFNMYIDIQRVAREGFTNIIKHSDADYCDIKLSLDNGYIFLDIRDNGRSLPEPLTESGRAGHRNIKFRTERYSGQFFADGDGSGYTLKASFRIPS